MKKKPKCKKWHSNDVMPREDRGCIFEINIEDSKETVLGFREGNAIRSLNDECICGESSVRRWCYIDLN